MPSEFENLGRRRFVDELADPRVLDRLIAYTRAEVGSQGPQAQQAFMESTLNRAVARGQPLTQTLSGSYFPRRTHTHAARPVSDADRAQYAQMISSVLGGSNIAGYATGNASGRVGFGGGPQTADFGRERFGIEGRDRDWWIRGQNVAAMPLPRPRPGLAELPSGPMAPPASAPTASAAPVDQNLYRRDPGQELFNFTNPLERRKELY